MFRGFKISGSKEILEGRENFHPKIHAGILIRKIKAYQGFKRS